MTLHCLAQVFELGGEVVQPALAHSLMRLIAEGAGEDNEQADAELRGQAVQSYLELLEKPKLPQVLLQVSRTVYDRAEHLLQMGDGGLTCRPYCMGWSQAYCRFRNK